MQFVRLLRYCLWGGVLATAEGNRRAYHMTTTWLPHLTTNTISLLLPDIYQLLAPATPAAKHNGSISSEIRHVVGETLATMLGENPAYVLYVTPLALGYLLSSPWFNIYKGALGDQRLGGFGLDALPHTMTAFALTTLTTDTARVVAEHASSTDGLAELGGVLDRNQTLLSALVLATVTIVWELGEYRIYKHELARRGSRDQINMQWSVRDTAYDCASNLIGWLLATGWRLSKQGK